MMRRKGERGLLMAGLMASVAIMMIMSAVAFQAWTDTIRRDNEAEMIFRAQDMVRAIQRYRRDHGGGPDSLERLLEPGPKGQYYLRRLYEDPLVPDGKWGLLYAAPGGGIIDPNAVAQTGLGGSGGIEMPDASGARGRRLGKAQGLGMQQAGMGRDSMSGQQMGFGDSQSGKGQMGGMLIAGVRTLCEDEPFRVYNGLTEYSEWLFTYLDLEQQQTRRKQPQQGMRLGQPTTPDSGGYPGSGTGPPSRQPIQ